MKNEMIVNVLITSAAYRPVHKSARKESAHFLSDWLQLGKYIACNINVAFVNVSYLTNRSCTSVQAQLLKPWWQVRYDRVSFANALYKSIICCKMPARCAQRSRIATCVRAAMSSQNCSLYVGLLLHLWLLLKAL